jgi:uncharacterized membrane protein YphA (DoxX/SURF4 family)
MTTIANPQAGPWSGLQKVLFRFFVIFFLLGIFPVGDLDSLPVWKYVQSGYNSMIDSVANLVDRHLLHIQPPPGVPLPVNDGAGDTSHFWAQLWVMALLSAIGCLVWSLVDRRRENYQRLGYYLRTAFRYYLAWECFVYGFLKIFCIQMQAPDLSQLATPLGDFGPMRMSWMYMGYGSPYEVFAGVAEVVAGLLLLYRRTVTLGLLAAMGVFVNVVMMNLTYDIPVKGFSMVLALCCLVLLVWDHQRLVSFLGLNQTTGGTRLYEPVDPGRGMRIARWVLKLYFIYIVIALCFFKDAKWYRDLHKPAVAGPIHSGAYTVRVFAINNDTIPPSFLDSTRWKDIVFEGRLAYGSVSSPDTSFGRKYGYGRGFFHYETDSVAHLLTITSRHHPILECRYELPDSNTVVLRGRLHQDSVYMVLQRSNHEFQLSEWQFHWISESNR